MIPTGHDPSFLQNKHIGHKQTNLTSTVIGNKNVIFLSLVQNPTKHISPPHLPLFNLVPRSLLTNSLLIPLLW